MVAVPNPKCYIIGMSDRMKKFAHVLNLVLIGARLARAIMKAYKLRTCRDRPSIIHYRAPRRENVTGSPR